jgi:hypothetical protein
MARHENIVRSLLEAGAVQNLRERGAEGEVSSILEGNSTTVRFWIETGESKRYSEST